MYFFSYPSKEPIADKLIYLKDSITTWQILAVSLSPTLGKMKLQTQDLKNPPHHQELLL